MQKLNNSLCDCCIFRLLPIYVVKHSSNEFWNSASRTFLLERKSWQKLVNILIVLDLPYQRVVFRRKKSPKIEQKSQILDKICSARGWNNAFCYKNSTQLGLWLPKALSQKWILCAAPDFRFEKLLAANHFFDWPRSWLDFDPILKWKNKLACLKNARLICDPFSNGKNILKNEIILKNWK